MLGRRFTNCLIFSKFQSNSLRLRISETKVSHAYNNHCHFVLTQQKERVEKRTSTRLIHSKTNLTFHCLKMFRITRNAKNHMVDDMRRNLPLLGYEDYEDQLQICLGVVQRFEWYKRFVCPLPVSLFNKLKTNFSQ